VHDFGSEGEPRRSISLIKATPARLIGHVVAPDEESAIKKAIDEFKITDPYTKRRLMLILSSAPWNLGSLGVRATYG
jgi:hypothetical protein